MLEKFEVASSLNETFNLQVHGEGDDSRNHNVGALNQNREPKPPTSTSSCSKNLSFWINSETFAVGFFANLGVLLRVAITIGLSVGPTNIPNQSLQFVQIFSVQPFLASNIFGCFVMAILYCHMKDINDFSTPLYKGLTTGLCGCLTTFSEWMTSSSANCFQNKHWFEVLLMIACEFSLTWGGFALGLEVNEWIVWVISQYARKNSEEKTDKSEGLHSHASFKAWFKRHEFYIWSSLFATTMLVLVVVLSVLNVESKFGGAGKFPPYAYILASALLAPIGVWGRWGLARVPSVKALWPDMNPQTLIANLLSVTLSSVILLVTVNSVWTLAILRGMCGSLSTVSTFFLEIYSLHKDKGSGTSWRYALTTFIVAFIIVQIVSFGGSLN